MSGQGSPLSDQAPLFECEDFRRIAGETLRPGGLALTGRALELCAELGALPPGAMAGGLALDLGCGEGATARLLAAHGMQVLALDSSDRMLRRTALRSGPFTQAVRGRAQALPLHTASLDAVFCECVLSVTGAAAAVLMEVARVLKPGGVLALSDLYLRGEGCAAQPHRGDCLSGALPRHDLTICLRAAGLAELCFEDHSRQLAELAARLVFAGLSPAGLGYGCAHAAAGDAKAETTAKPGYFLCLARKAEY